MARNYKRRRNLSRGRAPGKTFWLRPPSFNLTERLTNPGIFADIILQESDFSDPSDNLNDTKKGAPVLERIILEMGFDQVVTDDYFVPAAGNQVTMLVEYMVFTQSDQFAVLVDSDASFDLTLQNERILGYGVMDWKGIDAGVNMAIQCRAEVAPKSKFSLREKAIGVAIRTNFFIGIDESLSNFPWVQPTMLVRTP